MNEELRNNIATLEDDELLLRYHSGTLAEEAKHIFLDELERRGIDVAETSPDQVLYEQERTEKATRRAQTARGKQLGKQFFWIFWAYGGWAIPLVVLAFILNCIFF